MSQAKSSEFGRVFYLLFSYDNHSIEQAFLVETASVYCEAVTPFLTTCFLNFVLQKAKTIALIQIKRQAFNKE